MWDNPAVIYCGMLSGSLGGSALALYLTRGYTEGRNIENLSFGNFIEARPEGLSLGIPLPRLVSGESGDGGNYCRPGSPVSKTGLLIPVARLRY
jgi:hypothetical protein